MLDVKPTQLNSTVTLTALQSISNHKEDNCSSLHCRIKFPDIVLQFLRSGIGSENKSRRLGDAREILMIAPLWPARFCLFLIAAFLQEKQERLYGVRDGGLRPISTPAVLRCRVNNTLETWPVAETFAAINTNVVHARKNLFVNGSQVKSDKVLHFDTRTSASAGDVKLTSRQRRNLINGQNLGFSIRFKYVELNVGETSGSHQPVTPSIIEMQHGRFSLHLHNGNSQNTLGSFAQPAIPTNFCCFPGRVDLTTSLDPRMAGHQPSAREAKSGCFVILAG
ncbi:hypothetical protein EGW08_011195 [Elysia chlorotica]|uniref:Uncharacterized protein n=1 Tax=Elysia chlorotica TaxID=188477 RepID=A0A3S1BCV6_ELYCH|nr:hypothetical protein EGW08_011195 [Elysia chlorotica]